MSNADWRGDAYQRRFDDLAAGGQDVHGEARFVMGYAPRSVLDAGCGTGRVAIELARLGVEVVGVDVNASMLETARERGPAGSAWVLSDMADLDLGRSFDVVVMAGNVPLFTPDPDGLVAGCGRHLAAGGTLIAGFQLDHRYSLARYDAAAGAAGLALIERYGTWDREPFAGGDYAVSVHRRPPG